MNKNYCDARSMARMMLSRELNAGATSLPEDRIRSAVQQVLLLINASDVDIDGLVAELEASFQTVIGSERAVHDEDWTPWLPKKRADIQWRFWDRYRQYLRQEKNWPNVTIEKMDQTTDKVLGYLSDPQSTGAWDRRGMVVGHVQSGKTGNYLGLICKAADAGYKIIVVLAGFHKSLRSQTQIRLEEGFLGYDRGATLNDRNQRRVPVGVGHAHLYDQVATADSITTRADDGDFKRPLANNFAINPGGHPLLFVVKKNGSVLRNLLNWVRWVAQDKDENGRFYIKDVPLLVIDDEADQGSIDTSRGAFDENGNVDEDHNPTVLNALIRELLHTFDQSAYVGYTATPFANILIHEQGRTEKHGDDLFPRSFILSLPTDSNYVGPSRIFGFDGLDGEFTEPLPIFREVTDHANSLDLHENSGWVPPRHNKQWVPLYEGLNEVPPSLRNAIRSFVLVCAARSARGDEKAHNSMLVHVTRFTAVQNLIATQVSTEVLNVQRRLRHGDGDSPDKIIEELRALWQNDFEPTHQAIRDQGLGADCAPLAWYDLEPLVERAAFSIEVREINGAAGDVLDYISHEGTGLNIIAVGGDKLSRGLTLEGLTVSYFLRASKMYDTLMQMGRWFGYRPRFLDLCRLYTTSEMSDWFNHIAAASEELREDFIRMALSGGTPRDFGHRVQSHPLMLVTSAIKMRNGTAINLTFAGDISETVNFWRTKAKLQKNWKAAQTLLDTAEAAGSTPIPGTVRATEDATNCNGAWVWQKVSADVVLGFLSDYSEHDASKKVKTRLLSDYVIEEVKALRLTEWTVFVASGTSEIRSQLGSVEVNLVKRAWHGSTSKEKNEDYDSLRRDNHYRIRRLLSPADESADLTSTEWATAMERTLAEWKAEPGDRNEPTRPGGRQIREVRDQTRGLLLIYPLDPGPDGEDKVEADARDIPVIGFGISFPQVDAEHATKVRYVVNNVYWKQEFGGPNADDEGYQ